MTVKYQGREIDLSLYNFSTGSSRRARDYSPLASCFSDNLIQTSAAALDLMRLSNTEECNRFRIRHKFDLKTLKTRIKS